MSNHLDFKPIQEYSSSIDRELFNQIKILNKPAILRGCHFGDCMTEWNLDYLNGKLGNESIVIHESDESDLNFIEKNFKYTTCLFSQFADRLKSVGPSTNPNVYLRSTNRDLRAKKPANIVDDFPILEPDFKPPPFIPHGREDSLFHSSVLRIASADVQIWTHFDLYDNMLSQIVGSKRVILIPPRDTKHLYVQGDKSLVNNFDNIHDCMARFPSIAQASIYKCNLHPGDGLFIPALWWHNIRTLSAVGDNSPGYSIGFNIFWRDPSIQSAYGDNDTYGNKHLKPYESALANLDKALSHLDKLPEKYRHFHGQLLAERLKSKLNSSEKMS